MFCVLCFCDLRVSADALWRFNAFICTLAEFSDSWVYGRDISDDLIEDFERGFEYVQMSKTYAPPSSAPVGAKAKSKSKTKAKSNAGSRRYLVKVSRRTIILNPYGKSEFFFLIY